MIKSSLLIAGPSGVQGRRKSNSQRERGTTGQQDSLHPELGQVATQSSKLEDPRPGDCVYSGFYSRSARQSTEARDALQPCLDAYLGGF
jgi:hypothetical protein